MTGHDMTPAQAPLEDLTGRLGRLAARSLALWPVPRDATARLINLSENATYLVEGGGGHKSVLRVHRQGYHCRRAIECELAWIKALGHDTCVQTPSVIAGHDGQLIQEAGGAGLKPRFLVMFEFLPGAAPDETQDLTGPFEQLGAIAARTHLHAQGWARPEPFERLVWDEEAIFGATPTWGDWRCAPAMSAAAPVLEDCERLIRQRLARYGKSADRYGLVHADMRLANLLVDRGRTRLIDFDDCGFGWFLYDFAAGVSFMEDRPQIPALRRAWLRGYKSVRSLGAADEAEMDTFIMLRRMALLAWIGSHAETELAQEQGPEFTRASAKLAERYIASNS